MNIQIKSKLNVNKLQKYFEENVKAFTSKWDSEYTFPHKTIEDLFDEGVFAAPIPKTLGGQGLEMIDLMEIGKIIGYYSGGIFSTWIANMLAQTAVVLHAEKNLQSKILNDHLNNKSLMAFCVTEQETGTDIANMITTATPCASGYSITGKKFFITNANVARHFIVMAKTPDQKLTAFYVDPKSKGVSYGTKLKKLGQNESDTGEIIFNDVHVPSTNIIGKIGKGFDVVFGSLSRTRTLISAAACGMSTRAITETETYLTNSIRFGKPLMSKPELQKLICEFQIQMDAAWLLGCKAATVWDEKLQCINESSTAKYFAANMNVGIINECVELCGGHGYLNNNILSKLYRDAKLFEIYEGASQVHLTILAKNRYGKELKNSISTKAA